MGHPEGEQSLLRRQQVETKGRVLPTQTRPKSELHRIRRIP